MATKHLSLLEAAEIAKNGKEYLSISLPVSVMKTNKVLTWYTAGGDIMESSPGDYIVNSDTETWTVKSEILENTYLKLGDGTYRKDSVIYATQLTQKTVITTHEGKVRGRIGDWIATNSGEDVWLTPDKDFFHKYKEV